VTIDSESRLRSYERYIPTGRPLVERIFQVVLGVVLLFFFGLGLYFTTIEPVKSGFKERHRRLQARFLVQEQKPEPVVKEKKVKKEDKPVDLTDKPKMAQKDDDVREKQEKKKKVRRVYGIKKVYSRGIGSGGRLSDAVVGKLGNTLNKDVDTVTATEEDIKGDVVSVTTITSAPKFKKKVKPQPTPEMIEKKIEGVVKVKVLVDIDGKVKKALVLNDIGYGAAQQAVAACLAMEFEPARRGVEPVSVWIVIPIRFTLIG